MTDRESATERAFVQFHDHNPHVYRRLVTMARRLIVDQGHKRIGVQMLLEVLRWHHLSTTVGDADGFKLNNNYAPYYARLIMASEPELEGAFALRRLTVREPFGQQPAPEAPVGHVAPARFELPPDPPDPETLF